MNSVLRITCWTFLILLAGPAFSASNYDLLKLPGGWKPTLDGRMDDWPSEYFIDSIRQEANVVAGTAASRPWQRSNFQCRVYGAYDDAKIYLAIKIVSDDMFNNCGTSYRTCDNLMLTQTREAAAMYVMPNGAVDTRRSTWSKDTTVWVATRIGADLLPVYEVVLEKERTAPFGAGSFVLFVGTHDVDGQVGCDSGGDLCLDTTIVGVGVDAFPSMGEKSVNPSFTFSTRVGASLPKTTHVFWYKCIQNNYALQDSPGPNLSLNILRHEGMIVSSSLTQRSNRQLASFIIGSGTADDQGWCGLFWSKDLCQSNGFATKAVIRAEYRDYFTGGSSRCLAGPISIRCGVVDFIGNVNEATNVDSIKEDAVWADPFNPFLYTMGYNWDYPDNLMQEESLSYSAPAGKADVSLPSVLDKLFMEIDVTDQINWILSHTSTNKGLFSGQYAIVFMVPIGRGSTGRSDTYSAETCFGNMGSDSPWTKDGNTFHLVVESDNLSFVSAESPVLSHPQGVVLGSIHPNPFKGVTAIPYNTGTQSAGILSIYRPDGKLVFSSSVAGQGQMKWDATSNATGLYFCRLVVGCDVVSGAIVLMR